MDRASEVARATTERIAAGMSQDGGTTVGPVASAAQFAKVQALLEKGVTEGATLVVGGPGRPPGIDTGFYVRPTVFSYVTNDMAIAREEIFGPVATLIGYEDDDDAVRIANDTDYGLSAMVSSANLDRARSVARRIRAGMVHLNGAPLDRSAPFGGYKQSGNGREFGSHGLQEFLEVKSIYGHNG
jgi:aldehyde dehydrogenase (NAD+)